MLKKLSSRPRGRPRGAFGPALWLGDLGSLVADYTVGTIIVVAQLALAERTQMKRLSS